MQTKISHGNCITNDNSTKTKTVSMKAKLSFSYKAVLLTLTDRRSLVNQKT